MVLFGDLDLYSYTKVTNFFSMAQQNPGGTLGLEQNKRFSTTSNPVQQTEPLKASYWHTSCCQKGGGVSSQTRRATRKTPGAPKTYF